MRPSGPACNTSLRKILRRIYDREGMRRKPIATIASYLVSKGLSRNKRYTLARAPGGQMQGARAEGDVGAYRRGACNADPGPPFAACGGTAAGPDARPPPRPSGLRPPGPLAMLLAPYIPPRVCSSLAPSQQAWGPAAKCTAYSVTGPNSASALPPEVNQTGILRVMIDPRLAHVGCVFLGMLATCGFDDLTLFRQRCRMKV